MGTDYLPLITGGTGAIVVLVLWVTAFFTGNIHSRSEFEALGTERDYWREAYNRVVEANRIERQVTNETAQAGAVNSQLLTAFVNLASERKLPPAPGLTPEDLGL